MLDIRFATIADVGEIMEFINNNWKVNHILSANKELFLYEYRDGSRINFVISNDDSGKINGILGFIKASSINSDIWAAMWKVGENSKKPMLGIELMEYLRNSEDYNTLLCSKINEKTIGIYKYLGMYTDKLKQFVLINNKMKKFRIAKILDNKYFDSVQFLINHEYSLKQLSKEKIAFNFEDFKENIPYKDEKYFIKRYFNHPIYIYDVYGIFKNNKIRSLLVTRNVFANGSKALRIVDYIGEELGFKFIIQDLYKVIINENLEYIDFMCFGFDDMLLNAGFRPVNLDSSDLIIPNHFSPFVSKNIKMNFFVDTEQLDKVKICKADGDQDRPN
jgi:hypothetical protein